MAEKTHNSNELHIHRQGCGCGCDDGVDRRTFLQATGLAAGGLAFTSLTSQASANEEARPKVKQPANVRCAFLYPPSSTFTDDPEGWWSWPGNDYDAEGRQKLYIDKFREMEQSVNVRVQADNSPLYSREQADRFIAEMKETKPDGIMLVLFYNRSLDLANLILNAAAELGIPAIFYIGLGVKHGSVTKYRRPGVYFIQALEDFNALEAGLRMIAAKKTMEQTTLLSITEAPAVREGVEGFFGITVRVIPFEQYADLHAQIPINGEAEEVIKSFTDGAISMDGITRQSLENAAKAHLALKQMLKQEQADGVTMNCLRRGMLKPCMSFSTLNDELIPAACENDLPAVYTQLLGQLLTGRPGFQHNPAFDTERNEYYASHCTCGRKLSGEPMPFLLRRFAHTNEGSCAIQVFFASPEQREHAFHRQRATIVRYYPGTQAKLDVYAGRIVESYKMPPVGGCTTNVAVEITDRPDAMMVAGHHNLLFVGDFARRFREFANLYGMELADTGVTSPWPS